MIWLALIGADSGLHTGVDFREPLSRRRLDLDELMMLGKLLELAACGVWAAWLC